MGLGVAKINKRAIAQILSHETAQAAYGICNALVVGRNDFAEVFRVHARRECRRADQVGEQHGHLTALGAVFGSTARGGWGRLPFTGRPPIARVATQSSDGIQQLHTVTKRGDAKLLQVLVRQARENRLVYVILAEDRLILPETKAPQPDHHIHDGDPNSGLPHIIVPPGEGVQDWMKGYMSTVAPCGPVKKKFVPATARSK